MNEKANDAMIATNITHTHMPGAERVGCALSGAAVATGACSAALRFFFDLEAIVPPSALALSIL